jgi:hypothetical protein
MTSTAPLAASSPTKPTALHLGDDIRWNHELYAKLQEKFNIVRTYSMGREEFKQALREKRWGDFVAMYRPFWNTGGEMGNWDEELMYVFTLFTVSFCCLFFPFPFSRKSKNQEEKKKKKTDNNNS